MESAITYEQDLTCICVADCGSQITVDSVGEGGPHHLLRPAHAPGRVLAVAPRGMGERGGATPNRLPAHPARPPVGPLRPQPPLP